MNVTRISTPRSSRIEPALEQGWDEFTKLTWKAAAVAHDTGIRIEVHRSQYTADGVSMSGYYDLAIGSSITGPRSFSTAWDYLNGVATGAEQARRTLPPSA